MLTREEMKRYAMQICVPLMERTAGRFKSGKYAYKCDQVGYVPAFLENFCRPFWGIAPILAQGEDICILIDGESVSAGEYMSSILTEGFLPDAERSFDKYKEYFRAYSYENQNITEFAGLFVGIFFARKVLWENIPKKNRDLIAGEVYKMAAAAFDNSWPNNHYWFPVFAVTVLKRLGYTYERTEEILEGGLEILDGLYIGDGWYKDGEFGRFDYYEAWSLHLYPLLWTLIADETFKGYARRRTEYIRRTNKFLRFFTHWFASDGANVPFGRSLSYRFAASALFPVAVLAGCDIDASLAGRITCMNVEYFKKNYADENGGILREGYLYHAPCVVEGYTSDGGAYWCCKTFLALLIPKEHAFWQTEKALLPAEKGDFLLFPENRDIHMLFEGSGGDVILYNNTAQYYQGGKHTHHFGNMRSWYGKFVYSSAAGFGCSSSDVVSLDSMIGLETPDMSMTSHRLGYEDLGCEYGILRSRHIPFANDAQTYIDTWIIPLSGIHVRIHSVTLSQEYFVKEGGFSIGRWDDYAPVEHRNEMIVLENHEYRSFMKVVSDTQIVYDVGMVQAGCHMYAPLASYPMYMTPKPLKAGKYIFAGVYGLKRRNGGDTELPEIEMHGGAVIVRFGGREFNVRV